MSEKDKDIIVFDEKGEVLPEDKRSKEIIQPGVEKVVRPGAKANGEKPAAPGKPEATNGFTMDVDVPEKPEKKEPALEAAPAVEAPAYNRPTPAPKKKAEPKYVTRQAMIICMVIAIVVSTLLGAGIGMAFGGGNKGGEVSNPSKNKEHKNLSESSLDKATNSKLTIAEINDMNEDAVVEIVVEGTAMDFFGQTQLTEGAGSGVIVNENGYIVTNYHVIEGANKVQVTLHNGDSYAAQIVGGDNDNDIAVIKIAASGLTVATLGDSDTVDVGDLAVAIGNPLGQLGGTCTSGIISSLNRKLTIEDRTLNLLQTDSAINPGNSGGGLFNGSGELIGIVESKSAGTGIEGLGFAIPINSVKDEINDLIETGKVKGKPSIGITIYDVSEENANYYNLDGAGVYISEVTGTTAKKAGFESGDRIVEFNGEAVRDSSALISKVRACKIGDKVTVKVIRDGQEIEIKTQLEESVVND